MADAVRTPAGGGKRFEKSGPRSDEKRPYTGGGNRFDKAGEPRPFKSRRSESRNYKGTPRFKRDDAAPPPPAADSDERAAGRRASTASSPRVMPVATRGRVSIAPRNRRSPASRVSNPGTAASRPSVTRSRAASQEEVRRQGSRREGLLQGRQGRTRQARSLSARAAGARQRFGCASGSVPLPSSVCGSRCSSKYWRMFSNMSSWIFGLPSAQPMNAKFTSTHPSLR